jgi:hypothetical protein
VINQVLIIDTETTALETDQGQVIEVGAILYSVKHQTPLQQVATLLPANQPYSRCAFSGNIARNGSMGNGYGDADGATSGICRGTQCGI